PDATRAPGPVSGRSRPSGPPKLAAIATQRERARPADESRKCRKPGRKSMMVASEGMAARNALFAFGIETRQCISQGRFCALDRTGVIAQNRKRGLLISRHDEVEVADVVWNEWNLARHERLEHAGRKIAGNRYDQMDFVIRPFF